MSGISYEFDFSVIWESWRLLLSGTAEAVYITLVSGVIALVLGILIMLARRSRNGGLSMAAKVFIEVVRNTPFLVQLFFVYFGLPIVGIKFTVAEAGISALSINTAAYIAETLRGGVDGLNPGLVEAGKALGMSGRQIFLDIVLNPAIRSVYPALCSQFVLMMLMSSVLASISAAELTYTAQLIESRSFRSFEVYFVVTVIYLALSIVMSTLLKLLGRVYFSYPTK